MPVQQQQVHEVTSERRFRSLEELTQGLLSESVEGVVLVLHDRKVLQVHAPAGGQIDVHGMDQHALATLDWFEVWKAPASWTCISARPEIKTWFLNHLKPS